MGIEWALISVSDKTGVVELAGRLREMGVDIISTGGTGSTLDEAGVSYTPIAEHTGFPEILGGRVKTLHPRIHAGILARMDLSEHLSVLEENDIPPIGLVICNLYPFVETVSRPGVSTEEVIENIDIGGPTLIRAAAKNHAHVAVVVNPSDYDDVVSEMRVNGGQLSSATRLELARRAFRHTAAYDAAIARYFDEPAAGGDDELPERLDLHLVRAASLRYGENPHQRGALYRDPDGEPAGIVAAHQHQGKQLSFNNYMDLDAAWELINEFPSPACAIIKHTNPCGAALADTPLDAYRRALETDPLSAFGSIVAFNRLVDAEIAGAMGELFVEAVVAPGFDDRALEQFAGRKNLRVMQAGEGAAAGSGYRMRSLSGGLLVQDEDRLQIAAGDLETVSRLEPDAGQIEDLLFAWAVCKHVKSNAITLAAGGRLLGVGAGQMSRVDSVELATRKARSSLEGSVLASDAFFPFRDAVDAAAKHQVAAIIQPGGSIRDEEVITAADEHGIVMVLTGKRHFRH